MKCIHCIEKEKTWSKWNDPIECAFESGVFSENNWNCWTMDILRDMAQKNEVYNDDMYAWLIAYEFIDYEKSNEYWEVSLIWYLYLEWYKQRGKTDRCINMETLQPLTLELALKIWKNKKL